MVYVVDKDNGSGNNNSNGAVVRGVARIFYMGGPIFDDDDYHYYMDSLYF